MAGALANASSRALCAGADTLQRGALVGEACLNHEVLGVSGTLLCSVCNCGVQGFLYNLSNSTVGEAEGFLSGNNVLAANLVEYDACLAGETRT